MLVGTPLNHQSGQYLRKLLESWSKWAESDIDFYIVVNGLLVPGLLGTLGTLGDSFGLKNLEYEVQVSGHLEGWGALTRAQNRIRQRTIEGRYSHLLFHEASRMPKPGALSQLLRFGRPVAGALYKDTYHPGYYCVYKFDGIRNLHLPEPYACIDQITRPTRVYAIGFGFTLISSDVLEQVSFRSGKFAADTYFFEDLRRLKVPTFACPVYVENLKINENKKTLERWSKARKHILMRNLNNTDKGLTYLRRKNV